MNRYTPSDGNENEKQWILIGKTTNSAQASRPFVYFLAIAAKLHVQCESA